MSDNFKSLMGKFDFTEADLQANRTGSISENQRYPLNEMSKRKLIILIIVAVVCAFVVIATFTRYGNTSNGIFAVALAIVIAALVYVLFADYQKLQSDMASGTVDVVYGTPRFRTVSGRSSRSYLVSIGEIQFSLPRARYEALIAYTQRESQGAMVTAYFTPTAKVIVSLEPKS